MNIDQALIALLEKHKLDTISLNVSRSSNGGFYAYSHAHWEDSGNVCSSGHGDNAAEAIAKAITEANVKRSAIVDVPALEFEGADA